MFMEKIQQKIEILNGKPVIRGTRIPVDLILELLANGLTVKEITREYPELTEEDIRAALEFSSKLIRMEVIEIVSSR